MAPPADLILKRPSLRVAGWTIFALPWFWMRAPDAPRSSAAERRLPRRGWTPPRRRRALALERRRRLRPARHHRLGLRKGGIRARHALLDAAFHQPRPMGPPPRGSPRRSGPRVLSASEDGAVAWDIDAVRGDPSAQRVAHARRSRARLRSRHRRRRWCVSATACILSSGVRAVGARGGIGPSVRPVWGPTATLAAGGALGAFGAWDGLATATVLERRGSRHDDAWREAKAASSFRRAPRPWSRASAFAKWSPARPCGPTVGARRARHRTYRDRGAARAACSPTSTSPLVHVIEPRLRASVMAARTSGAYFAQTGRPVALVAGQMATASAGLRTAWGQAPRPFRWIARGRRRGRRHRRSKRGSPKRRHSREVALHGAPASSASAARGPRRSTRPGQVLVGKASASASKTAGICP